MRSKLLLSTLLLGACEYDEPPVLDVRIYGEAFIEEGIPADVFVDGWTVRFDKFLVSVGGVVVKGDREEVSEPGFQVFDLSRPSKGVGQPVVSEAIVDGAYDDTQYVIAPSADAVAGNASAADLKLLKDGGHSLYVSGTATKGGESLKFAWGFATRTSYSACESQASTHLALRPIVQLTIHGDHLFYDDLFASEPNVSFDLVASADADGDGVITQAELTAVDLRPLANYQVGSTDIVDLWHFIEHQTTTLGHIDGEGHCESVRES